jgi:hypothetical protein
VDDALPHPLLREERRRLLDGGGEVQHHPLQPGMTAAERHREVAVRAADVEQVGTEQVCAEQVAGAARHRRPPHHLAGDEPGQRQHAALVEPPVVR